MRQAAVYENNGCIKINYQLLDDLDESDLLRSEPAPGPALRVRERGREPPSSSAFQVLKPLVAEPCGLRASSEPPS